MYRILITVVIKGTTKEHFKKCNITKNLRDYEACLSTDVHHLWPKFKHIFVYIINKLIYNTHNKAL